MIQRAGLFVLASAMFAGSALPCVAQDNPWNGSWKVDPAASHFEGAVYTFTTDANGFSIMDGGKEVSKAECLGKPMTNPSGTVTTCTKVGKGYSLTTTRDGKPTSVVTMIVSPSGKKLTRSAHYTPAGEEPYTMSFTYDRVGSGGMGVAGDWREAGFSESQDTGILKIMVTGDSVAFQETDSPKPMVCKLDGTPTVTQGTSTMSVTLVDPHTLKVRYMNKDKAVIRENTFALSLDGKTISETDFTADPTPSAQTQLLHKM